MSDLRKILEVLKWLSLRDLMCVSCVCSFWRSASVHEEVWFSLLSITCDGLLLPTTQRLALTSRQLYRVLFTPKVLPVLWGSRIARFDIRTRQTRFVQLNAHTLITKGSYAAYLPDTSLFVCGGDTRSGSFYDEGLQCAYRIAPISFAVSRLMDMQQRRRYPGACYYAGTVCVFGGADGTMYLNSAEVHILRNNSWEALPSMLGPRTSCTPARYENEAFLAGGFPSSTIEAYHFLRRSYRMLPIAMQSDVDCVAVFHGSDLLTFTHQEMRKIDITSMIVTEKHSIQSHDYVWSATEPKWVRGQVWFYYWHLETVVEYDVEKKVFEHVKSFTFADVKQEKSSLRDQIIDLIQ